MSPENPSTDPYLVFSFSVLIVIVVVVVIRGKKKALEQCSEHTCSYTHSIPSQIYRTNTMASNEANNIKLHHHEMDKWILSLSQIANGFLSTLYGAGCISAFDYNEFLGLFSSLAILFALVYFVLPMFVARGVSSDCSFLFGHVLRVLRIAADGGIRLYEFGSSMANILPRESEQVVCTVVRRQPGSAKETSPLWLSDFANKFCESIASQSTKMAKIYKVNLYCMDFQCTERQTMNFIYMRALGKRERACSV